MSIDTVRHHEVFDASQHKEMSVLMVGMGAIGSRLAENLVSTGLTNFTFIDFDEVESHNLANQLYTREHIGMPKVEAFKQWAINKCGQDAVDGMTFINGKIEDIDELEADIVISCVDSFSARRLVMDAAKKAWATLFVDTRMTTDHATQYMIEVDKKEDVTWWEGTLGDDADEENFERSACGSTLSVGATAQTSGAVGAWSVMNYLKSAYIERVLRVDTSPWLASRTHG